MKTRILVALALLAQALPAAAEPLDVHVIAWLPPEVGQIIAVEFGIANLPFAQCDIQAQWDTSLVIGSIDEGGLALAFLDGLSGPFAHLGTLRFTCLEPVGDNHEVEVVGSTESGNLLVVTADGSEIDAWGGLFCFNPNDYWWPCDFTNPAGPTPGIYLDAQADGLGDLCAELLPETIPVDHSSWSAVKSLY